jgi:toxin ParE1/3/4
MKVVFDSAARDDLDRIFAWIANDNPRAAYEMVWRIEARLKPLRTPGLAHIGRPGLVAGTRELVEPPYIIVYTVDEQSREIRVISIVHGARKR